MLILMTRVSRGPFTAIFIDVTHLNFNQMVQVSVVDLEQVMAALRAPVLFLASDGFWDLWSYQEVFEHVVCEGPDSRRYATAMEFKRVNGQKGNAEFGDSCDNMTGIFIYLEREADHVVEEEAGRGGKGDGDDGDGDGGGEDWI
ncbi:hypothetical protein T492DRAFT_918253 [Pavlovales sp. CCMP2436]|nr:hypothetical protein T492DRAFT_918253 [Pavlovales sp. CCMP2436]